MIENKYQIVFHRNYMTNPRPCKNITLVQIGESLLPNNANVIEHKQQWFELSFISNGKGTISANTHSFSVDKNDCFLSFPDEVHKLAADQNSPLRYIFLAFSAKEKSYENKLMTKITELCKDSYNRKINIDKIKPLLLNGLSELQNEDAHTSRILGTLIEQILIEIYRKVLKNHNSSYAFKEAPKEILAYDIITHIDRNIATIKKLSDLEETFFYKLQYLSKIFKSQTGVSINQYFVSKKMETATAMLKEGKSVTEVSESLNYSSIHAFSRAYLKYFGQPPSYCKTKKE